MYDFKIVYTSEEALKCNLIVSSNNINIGEDSWGHSMSLIVPLTKKIT